MIEMEIYERKNEQGLVVHAMDICYFRKKRMPSMSTMTKRGVEVENENDHELSLIFWSARLLYCQTIFKLNVFYTW
jgi:hypothetical protein